MSNNYGNAAVLCEFLIVSSLSLACVFVVVSSFAGRDVTDCLLIAFSRVECRRERNVKNKQTNKQTTTVTAAQSKKKKKKKKMVFNKMSYKE